MENYASQDIKVVYEQICKQHGEISEFRAKLLALLPLASGAGIFLLFNEKLGAVVQPHLLAIGLFGALVTLGLFLHELRGIQICIAISKCGEALEERLLKVKRGRFQDDPGPIWGGLVGATWGAIIIYASVIAAWSYIGSLGCYGLDRRGVASTIAGGILVSTVILGNIVSWKQREGIKRRCLPGIALVVDGDSSDKATGSPGAT